MFFWSRSFFTFVFGPSGRTIILPHGICFWLLRGLLLLVRLEPRCRREAAAPVWAHMSFSVRAAIAYGRRCFCPFMGVGIFELSCLYGYFCLYVFWAFLGFERASTSVVHYRIQKSCLNHFVFLCSSNVVAEGNRLSDTKRSLCYQVSKEARLFRDGMEKRAKLDQPRTTSTTAFSSYESWFWQHGSG